MDIEDLRNTSDASNLPSDHLRALWHDLNGDWDTAHSIVQRLSDREAMWIHAYLHRKEPDVWNAKYWYRRARKSYPGEIGFEEEAISILESISG